MPQGGIDEGENPEAAAFRELSEETGIHHSKARLLGKTKDWLSYDIPVDLIPKLWGGRYRGQKTKMVCLRISWERFRYKHCY